MSNACIKTLAPSRVILRSFQQSTAPRLRPGRDAFFAQFYSIVTGQSTKSATCFQRSQPAVSRTRQLHESTQLAAKRAPPKTRSQQARNKPRDLRSLTFENVKKEQLDAIFKTEIEPKLGRTILKTIHQRRVSGSMLEYGLAIEDVDVKEESVQHALDWLREKYPIDEQAAVTDWADREALKLQDSYILRAQRLGLIKKTKVQERQDAIRQADNRSSYSAMDALRQYYKDKTAKADKEYVESGKYAKDQELRLAKVEERKSEQEQRQKALEVRREKQQLAGMVSHSETAPEMSSLRRLGPATLFAALLTGGFVYYATTYSPPTLEQRWMQDLTPALATTVTLAASCTLICCLWHVPRLWRVFNKYLVAVPADPYVVSIIGNVFSHTTFTHLGVNMAFLFVFGPPLHEMVGRGNFLTLYCLGGMFGSITSMYWFVLRGNLTTYSTGASGAVAAIAFAWAVLTLSRDSTNDSANRFYLDTGRYCMLFFQIIAHFAPGVSSRIDVASHIGGALLGVFGASLLKWRQRRAAARQVAPAGAPVPDTPVT